MKNRDEVKWMPYEEYRFHTLYYKALELMMFRYGIGPFPGTAEERNRVVEATMKEIEELEKKEGGK